jgi:hypothetical protein
MIIKITPCHCIFPLGLLLGLSKIPQVPPQLLESAPLVAYSSAIDPTIKEGDQYEYQSS